MELDVDPKNRRISLQLSVELPDAFNRGNADGYARGRKVHGEIFFGGFPNNRASGNLP